MDTKILIQSFTEFAKQKNVDRPTMIRILQDVFRAMIKKKYENDENFDIVINADNGDLEIMRFREIVDDNSEDIWDFDKIAISDAKKIEKDFVIGDEVAEEIKIEDFGRRAVILAKQTLIQRVKDLEKEIIISKYDGLVGEIITGEIYQILSREVLLVDIEGSEISLPRSEQIPKDRYRKGDSLRGIVLSVEMFRGNPKITLSRTNPKFLEKLFEKEVPEIFDGLITIKKIVREPGERAKICVESYDDRIDPVGACVGMNGSRIHSIVRELQNENIDVINFTENTELYITRALSPAKITSLKIEKENKPASKEFCPIYCGTTFLDNCIMLESMKVVKFFDVSYPLLFLPFLSRASNVVGKKISVQYEGNNFLLNFDKTIFSKNIKSDQVVSLAREFSIEFLENNNSFSVQEWKELYKLSEETFVEESESSKIKGAGAGLKDND